MKSVFFLDLDDTFFQVRRKCMEGEAVEAVGLASDGRFDSFMTSRQRALFELLSASGEVIPTTGRSVAALRRVLLPFGRFAVCSFGGVVLGPEGRLEPRWHAHVAPQVLAVQAELDRLTEAVRDLAAAHAPGTRVRVIVDQELPLYLSIKHDEPQAVGIVATRARALVPPPWRLWHNERNLAILPPFLGKEHAVSWLRREFFGAGTLCIGVGDSLSDLPFLAQCDFAMMPSASQLLRALETS